MNVCVGHPEEQYVALLESRGGEIKGCTGLITAVIDDYFPVVQDGVTHTLTVRHHNCKMITLQSKCNTCLHYRPTLRSMVSRKRKQHLLSPSRRTATTSRVNFRYLRTPEKATRFANRSAQVKRTSQELVRLKGKIDSLTRKEGITLDANLHKDMADIVSEETENIRSKFTDGSFQRLFWDQQLEYLKLSDSRNIRWHPMMIKWCLSLKFASSSAYEALRSSGVVRLPSSRTLRDYTHFIKAHSGFSNSVDKQLQTEARIDDIPEYQKYIGLIFDEVKVKENLVFNKHSGELIGFLDIGEVNNQLVQFEEACKDVAKRKPLLATHMIVFMVTGLLSHLTFAYAQFPSLSVTSDQLYSLVWACVRRLEMAGFKVISLTCDGAGSNRKFFKLHGKPDEFVYKTTNVCAEDPRPLFFISDPPHLIKTVRNCWANSYRHSGSRKLSVCNNNTVNYYTIAIIILDQ